ncbi:hypothetical protein Kpol_1045p34 [Vanderwaltozyma polyspora DSM 70294]|uniref:Glutamyl-tRNA(Gln) amidotransferase subunit B, mitochondrial n=1 Tax=Vanderwaltozyma polyspora (strain ATCC 22028 / DSM 70294 / BCRC 21397 / CBS 2163 / NBRC 10782 / NRRL Y-8283 / UCD 57-17) TaxID=436907 RepID=GATB_VANPO|nr:uncharacterized protein Kpol_1045p34 [Vanderwaltozyma polyspora DSM 70294]A7TI41.1 RecName: Full=Glutamyl-tRNA(Gln) amidotransferase subunit B, mitochondrial; Short=Glu-AdT subunit B [Vanderwaltozyma polyspora DSM 70294]EDO18048.1 hypothetical protein Kpol_1045p34 [Vanderwaltozyma polyspora DSM 70294]
MLKVSKRYYGFQSKSPFQLLPDFRLKCGLEIHTQLNTKFKLFSFSTNDPFHSIDSPNSNVSFFDAALPGTQPILNYEAVIDAIKLSLALNCDINANSQFDRKHYFYGDQPLGYQITQHYSPISSNGKLSLFENIDNIDQSQKDIGIIQLQIEQDTGKSMYDDSKHFTRIDLNRSNVPLIEMVTKPDFTDLKQVRSFIKKYQNLVRHLKISSGDLETGAMRVDVNLSINDYARVELKNLPNTSSIVNAIKYEYNRQVEIIKNGSADELLTSPETRSWTGVKTVKLRSKETTIDYRYLPDPELPRVILDNDVITNISNSIPTLPDELLSRLISKPYNLSMKDAKILVLNSNGQNEMYTQEELQNFYLKVFDCYYNVVGEKLNHKLPVNWIIHELIGSLNKLELPLSKVLPKLSPEKFSEFIVLIHNKEISNTSAKLLLFHVLNQIKENDHSIREINFDSLIEEFELKPATNASKVDLTELCQTIITELNNEKLLNDIISGKKKNSIQYLVGLGMRASQGTLSPQSLEETFKKILQVKW